MTDLKKKERILIVNGHLRTGGVERSLITLLQDLDYSKYDVDLLLLEDKGEYFDLLPKEVNVMFRPITGAYGPLLGTMHKAIKNSDWFSIKYRLVLLRSKFFGLQSFGNLKNAFTNQKKYDLAIGYRSGISTVIAGFACNAKKRITWWHHGEINVGSSYADEVSTMDRIITVSNSVRKKLADTFPELSKKMITIPNAISFEEIHEKAGENIGNIDISKPVLVSIGRLSPEKNYQTAIEAARMLRDKKIEFIWYFIGDGIEKEIIVDMVQKESLTDYVHLIGSLPNPYPYLKHAQIFVHPSIVESQGISVLEALALNVPVVAVRNDGVSEFLEDENNSLVVENNAGEIARAIEDLMFSPDLYAQIKRNCTLPAPYRTEIQLKKIDELFRS